MSLTVQDVVTAASLRTGRRAEDPEEGGLNLAQEFWLAFLELCLEQHFWWRKKSATFSTVAGTATYDLSDSGITTPQADDFYEMDKVYIVNSDNTMTEIAPILDPEDQAKALSASTNGAVDGGYMIDPNSSTQTLRLSAPADSVKTIRVFYWALPNPAVDSSTETIPLIPPQLHWGLPIMLERSIFRFLYGVDDPRYLTADARYREFASTCGRGQRWTTNFSRGLRTTDAAVRSHD